MALKSKIFTLFVTLALLAWLMPLGAFIRPSQEKTACGGKRGMHMCSMMKAKINTESSSTVSFSMAGQTDSSPKSAASGGDDLVPEISRETAREAATKTYFSDIFFHESPSLDRLDPPPRFLTTL